ncbi:Ig-like domain-containing protein [uncultured Algibacter sp.]|uniref:Ig-like domain-containing protein n=1 Tax=uncultured Algibacter sp. TaxID=298659 RepID=UPI0026034F35|nr:Ig-like domain-containing protein [uncultured Algibacter sp.]
MKYVYLFLVVLLFGCGGSDDGVEENPPVAANDTAITLENTSISISVLNNDTLTNNAMLTDFDATSVNSGTINEASNKLIYTPANNFTGTDTFTYTICDGLSNPNCAVATVTVTVSDTGNPVAENDTFEVTENTTTIFTTLLDNDTIVDGAILTSIDATSSTGIVILNNDSTVSYTAMNGFSGEDTFTYTLCDNDAIATCVTATVTINVLDEGVPVANNDAVNIFANATSNTLNILENDTVIDDAVITAIDNALTQGTVVLNADGTVSYSPQTDFTGIDSFTYTICDDDSPTPTCSTATVTVTVIAPLDFNIPAEIIDYYNDVIFSEDGDLMFDELEDLTVTNHTTILAYTQRHNYLYLADADLSNSDNVILMYSGESRYWEEYTSGSNAYSPQTFNTEHIYPQSLYAGGDGGAEKDEIVKADLHHLRSCDATVNSDRLNYAFTDGSGTYKLIGEKWFPGDEWKGDVARMILYLNIRYGESFNTIGSLELFLKWNLEDPVSAFEEQRNNVIYAAQGNRNPFIDNAYLATLIWGGDAAENKWN